MPLPIYLIYGNQEDVVSRRRYEIQRELLPRGDEDGEVVDIRGAGNQPLKIDKAFELIVQELGTVSLIEDSRRVVVVWDLADLRAAQRGSARAAKKESKGKRDYVAELESYLKTAVGDSNNALIFVHEDDDEKNRKVAKSAPLFQMIQRLGGRIEEHSEKRIDWQFEDALLSGNLDLAIRLLREWDDRGGNATFRIVAALNGFLQLLLQARLREEAQRAGRDTRALFPEDMRPSLGSIPPFKAKKFSQLALRVPLDRIRTALGRFNDAQKAFYPTGDELVIRDPRETLELMLIELVAPAEATRA